METNPMLNKNGLLVFHDVRHNPPGGIKPIYYKKIKPLLKDSFEYFVNEKYYDMIRFGLLAHEYSDVAD